MVKIKERPTFQWCIAETYVNEVSELPSEITIHEIAFNIGFSLKRVVSTVPQELLDLGVTYMREPSASLEAQGTLNGTRSVIVKKAKAICKHINIDYRHMRVARMTLKFKSATLFFTRMTKRMKGTDDKPTYTMKVLGLVKAEGDQKDINQAIKYINANRIRCHYSTELIQTVVCDRS